MRDTQAAGLFDGMRIAGALALGLWIAGGAPAQEIHLDVSFQENESDGRLSVHGRDFGPVGPDRMHVGKRVFGRDFELSGFSLVQNDPGFTSSDNAAEIDPWGLDAVVPNEQLHFRILAAPSFLTELGGRNLSYWDGSGNVSWGPLPNGTNGLEISDPGSAVADGTTSHVAGFVLDTSDSEGGMHRHPDYRVLPSSGADGVYLLLLEGTLEPYAEWIPFYILFAGDFAGQDTALPLAMDDVETNLLFPLCSDGIDNDRDGHVDVASDGGCVDAMDMSERGAANECDNGIDDDMDGFVDYPNDPGCGSAAGTMELPEPGLGTGLMAGMGLVACLGRRRGPRREGRPLRGA